MESTSQARFTESLPQGWSARLDVATGKYYFIDPFGNTTWSDPRKDSNGAATSTQNGNNSAVQAGPGMNAALQGNYGAAASTSNASQGGYYGQMQPSFPLPPQQYNRPNQPMSSQFPMNAGGAYPSYLQPQPQAYAPVMYPPSYPNQPYLQMNYSPYMPPFYGNQQQQQLVPPPASTYPYQSQPFSSVTPSSIPYGNYPPMTQQQQPGMNPNPQQPNSIPGASFPGYYGNPPRPY